MTSAGMDGRTARAQRTREAVTSALVELILEGGPAPTASRIADRAGVSARSLYVHFASLDDLYQAVIDRATAMIVSVLAPIDPDQPIDARVDLLCGQRARINEEVGPLLRAGERREAASARVAVAREAGRRASREQIDRIFRQELDRFDTETRRRRIAAIDALLQERAWAVLRESHALTPDEARVAVVEALRALLAEPSG
jgi:AcrR family transcriptional regulator